VAELPPADELPALDRNGALLLKCFGDLGLIDGSWPAIAPLEGWRREDWPLPPFRHTDDVSGSVTKVTNDDELTGEQSREHLDPADAEGLPEDGLAGAQWVSKVLTRRLS
jgi:hypothetical protein